MIIPKIRGIYQISDELALTLNSATAISQDPIGLTRNRVHESLERRASNTGYAYFTKDPLPEGEVVVFATGSRINRPLVYSRQIDDGVHIVTSRGIDHHCVDPNLVVDPQTNNLVARRIIKPEERLTFNYLTTEWDMINPFQCINKEDGCYGIIAGFKYLTLEQRRALANEFPIANYLLKYLDS